MKILFSPTATCSVQSELLSLYRRRIFNSTYLIQTYSLRLGKKSLRSSLIFQPCIVWSEKCEMKFKMKNFLESFSNPNMRLECKWLFPLKLRVMISWRWTICHACLQTWKSNMFSWKTTVNHLNQEESRLSGRFPGQYAP